MSHQGARRCFAFLAVLAWTASVSVVVTAPAASAAADGHSTGYYWSVPCEIVTLAAVEKTVHSSFPKVVPETGERDSSYVSNCDYWVSFLQTFPNVVIALAEDQPAVSHEPGTPEPTVGPTAACVSGEVRAGTSDALQK